MQLTEVLGQRKLLRWSAPGVAHFLTFWGFIILVLTIIEAYGDLFDVTFAIPLIGHWAVTGFAEDLFAVAVLAGIGMFAVIRLRGDPRRAGRASRFAGSHTGAAWLVLAGIFLVIATLLLYRGAQVNTGDFPYPHGAFASQAVGHWLRPLGRGANDGVETAGILAQLAVLLGFLVFVTYSKHLHIFLAPVNVLFSRRPDGLRGLEPMRSDGKVLDFEEADPDADVFGIGKIEDLSWKGMLDLATCTECGRCQSQCPAWATGKPLSPKMVILDLRDHALAKAPYLLAGSGEARGQLPEPVRKEAERPLVGDAAAGGVIDPDVLWSCTSCGACVEECPVDIEHLDHITGMRRHQVLIESAFPAEAASMLRNLENKGDPWGMGGPRRAEWAEGLGFEVPVLDGAAGGEVEYLFWVGCAGALEDRAKKTTRAIAGLLHAAGVKFAVLGPAETCTGDPARRMGNEFVYSMLAQQNIATLNGAGVRKIVASCPHCFNAIANEYPQLGGDYEVVHHTQLLARLVAEGRLAPVTPVAEKVTYHDPCFRRCTAARSAGSAAAPAVPGCGWKNGSASGSAPSGSTRPSARTRTPSPPAARTAWSCSATLSAPGKAPARRGKPSKSSTSPSSSPAPSAPPARRPTPARQARAPARAARRLTQARLARALAERGGIGWIPGAPSRSATAYSRSPSRFS